MSDRVPRNTYPKGSRPLYGIWKCMNNRCHNPKSGGFKGYGGRGIFVCDSWRDTDPYNFFNFLRDIPTRPSKGHSLDRVDNDRGYSPDNVRWATQKEQCNNTRKNVYLDYEGETRNLTQWAEHLGILVNTLQYRLKRGCTPEEAITGNRDVIGSRIPMLNKVGAATFKEGLDMVINRGAKNQEVADLWACDNSQVSRLKRAPKVLLWWEENK